ncbi:MAG: hypothetical protein OSB82_16765, partial [Alphaproteobacteria bacterium]|nr:hypothetical protein [Alphaproteobacteria bacterium]
NRFNSNFGHKKGAGPGRSTRACGANSAYHTELGGFPIRLFQCGNATLCKLKLQEKIYLHAMAAEPNSAQKSEASGALDAGS